MTSAWTLQNWNNITEQINDKRLNPPEHTICVPKGAIDFIYPPYRWSKRDIILAQEAISSMCPTVNFSPVRAYWSKQTVGELTSALVSAWCDCPSTSCYDTFYRPTTSPTIYNDYVDVYTWVDGICKLSSGDVPCQRVKLNAFDELLNFQLYPDYNPSDVRWFVYELLVGDFPGLICYPREETVTLMTSLVSPNGQIAVPSYAVPQLGRAIRLPYSGAKRSYYFQIRGFCFSVTLSNNILPKHSPANTHIGNIIITGSPEAIEDWEATIYNPNSSDFYLTDSSVYSKDVAPSEDINLYLHLKLSKTYSMSTTLFIPIKVR